MGRVIKVFRPHKGEVKKITLDFYGWFIYQTEIWDINNQDYLYKKAKGRNFLFHRKMVRAKENEIIDHKNRDSLDNRRSNLRYASKVDNFANSLPWGKTGFKGVKKRRGGNYQANICISGRYICLGTYKTPEEAARAYNKAAFKQYGEYAWLNPV